MNKCSALTYYDNQLNRIDSVVQCTTKVNDAQPTKQTSIVTSLSSLVTPVGIKFGAELQTQLVVNKERLQLNTDSSYYF
jgi:hypothetical protein